MSPRGPSGRASVRTRRVRRASSRALPLLACSAVLAGTACLAPAAAQETIYIGGSDQPSVEINLDALNALEGGGAQDQGLRHPGARSGGEGPVFLTPPGQTRAPAIKLTPPGEHFTPIPKPAPMVEDTLDAPVVEAEPDVMVAPPRPRPEPEPEPEVARVAPEPAETPEPEPELAEPEPEPEVARVAPEPAETPEPTPEMVEPEPPLLLVTPVLKPRPEPRVAKAEPKTERRALAPEPEPDAEMFETAPPRLVKPEAKPVRRKTKPIEAKAVETAEPKAVDSEPVAAKPPAEAEPTRTASLTPTEVPGVGDDSLRIVFDQSQANLPQQAKGALGKIASRLTEDPLLRLQLKAYADGDAESASQARRLSLSRALAVRSELIEAGVRSTRIDVRALGNKTEDGPSDRVDVFIIKR